MNFGTNIQPTTTWQSPWLLLKHSLNLAPLAAQAAQAGVTGSLDVIDGESGIGRAMSNGPDWT